MPKKERKPITIRITDEEMEKLKELAKLEHRSINSMLERLLQLASPWMDEQIKRNRDLLKQGFQEAA